MVRQRWVFIGDSLVEFCDWHNRFPEAEVLNLGMAGETVEGLFARLQSMIERWPLPDRVFIMSGINNVGMEHYDFAGTYESIIELVARKFPKTEIIANSLLPARLPWISDKIIPQLNQTLRESVLDKGAEFLDCYDRFLTEMGETDEKYFLPDGVHLSSRGYDIWAGAIADYVQKS